MKGRVLKSTGSWYSVQLESGNRADCRVRGKMRLDDSKETNPVAVGDEVEVDPSDHTIVSVLPRHNHIVRQSTRKTGHRHVLAANLDQALLLVTLFQPKTSFGFIDRFLVTCEAYGIPQLLVINKRDLLVTEDDVAICNYITSLYASLGVRTFIISAAADAEVRELLNALKGKTTLLAGHSGTGKSTLLNRLVPDAAQEIGPVSAYSDKGTHTTTFAEMFRVNDNTFLVDTPGIKEWGLLDMEPQEISGYFPEMHDLRNDCRFGGRCLHLEEPGCAVVKAVQEEKIAATRYESYVSMVLGGDNRK